VLTATALLDLEQIGPRTYRARNHQGNAAGHIFGGSAVGQALAAAQRTTTRAAHNVSCLFLSGGSLKDPVDYEVELLRDGKSFASRRVLANQNGKPILDMLCSFHEPEEGFEHQTGDLSDVPPPESLPSVAEFTRANLHRLPDDARMFARPFPIEYRVTDPEGRFFGDAQGAELSFWFRMDSAAAFEDDRDHRCVLAFMSDWWLGGAARLHHVGYSTPRNGLRVATINHSLWLHRPARADQWLFYQCESPWTGQGRGLARGLIYDRGGRLVATTVQEISLRPGKAPA
jgi:acyl-CoA thioesterase-2